MTMFTQTQNSSNLVRI